MSWLLPEIRVFESPASRWDARWKLATVAASMMLISAIDDWPPAVVGFAFAGCTTLWARLPLLVSAKAVVGVVLPVAPWFVLLPILNSWAGAAEAALWLFRLSTVACFGAMLIRSTGIPRLLEAASALLVPGLLVRVAQFAYRFAFVLTTELRRLRIGLFTRGFRMRSNAHTFQTLGAVVGGAIVRSEARAERVAQAMTCRGFHGHLPRLTPFHTRTADVLTTILFLVIGVSLACATFVPQSWLNP